jgi:phospholipid/cholesterol/gamma-HCH transport system substrate-binding protein
MNPHRRRFRGLFLLSFTVVCVGIFLVLLHIAGGLNLAPKYNFDAVVPDAVELVPGANVREAGVDVGTVTGISNRGATALIAIALNKDYAPIYRDATIRVATKTLVGENYIDLDPGDQDTGAVTQNGLLPISQAQDAVQLDQILSTFDPARQAELRRLLKGLGGGLSGTGPQLNQTIDALSGTASAAAPVAQALSDQSQQLASLVSNLGEVFSALGQRSSEIQTFVTAGTHTAQAVAAEQAALRDTLADLPSTIGTVRTVTNHLASVGTAADPVLDNLGAALSKLTPALSVLPSAGAATLAALDRLHDVTPVAERLVTGLRNTAPTAEEVVPALAALVNQLRPLVGYLAPYATDLSHLLFELDSAGTPSDASGLLANLVGVVSAESLTILTPAERQLLNTLVGAGAAQIVTFKGINNYPAPNTAGDPQPFSGNYPRLRPDTGG